MLNQEVIFFPLLAQVFLTMLVWLWLYKTRITEMRKRRVKPQALANHLDLSKLLQSVIEPSDNFKNLFETPVLFYVAIITIYITQMVDFMFVILTSVFVLFRYLHSFIHISYNRVTHRFSVYIASTCILWVIWLLIGLRLVDIVKL